MSLPQSCPAARHPYQAHWAPTSAAARQVYPASGHPDLIVSDVFYVYLARVYNWSPTEISSSLQKDVIFRILAGLE